MLSAKHDDENNLLSFKGNSEETGFACTEVVRMIIGIGYFRVAPCTVMGSLCI